MATAYTSSFSWSNGIAASGREGDRDRDRCAQAYRGAAFDHRAQVLVEATTRGDPESPLLWTARSQRNIVAALAEQGHQASMKMVSRLLKELGYSLQANRKRQEGAQHPDRNALFEHINEVIRERHNANEPVISVDTKKKELVGPYKNGGSELRPKGDPEDVNVHDFVDPETGRASPYGVYDLRQNEAWVSVGLSHDTGEFAVQTIRTWWKEMGAPRYPHASSLTITADGGGSHEELAWLTAPHPPGHRQPDRRDDNETGPRRPQPHR